MRKYCVLFIIVALGLAFQWTTARAVGEKKIAVLELVNKAGITDDEAYALTDQVRIVASRMLPGAHFIVMTTENILDLLPPDMTLKKCSEAKCEVEVGRMLGADYIITGEIIKFGGRLQINLRAHHSFSAHFVFGGDVEAGDIFELKSAIRNLAGQLMTGVLTHAKGGVISLPPEKEPPKFANPGYLDISAFPTGARIFINEERKETIGESGASYLMLPPATYMLKIITPGGKIFEREVRVKAGEKTPVVGGKEMMEDPQPAATGTTVILRVDSVFKNHKGETISEEGAKIILDGNDTGKTTPAGIKIEQPGLHKIDLIKPLFHTTRNYSVVVEQAKAQQSVTIPMNPAFANVRIDTKPSNAQIFIDGRSMGRTPYENQRFESGMHELSFRYEHYHDFNETVVIKDNTPYEKTFDLKPAFVSLGLDIKPKEAEGARVLLDHKFFSSAPFKPRMVPSGEYLLTVKHPKYKEYNERITLIDGQEITLKVNMIANWTVLEIETKPCAVEIIIDGQSFGKTGQASQTIDSLKPGDHFVELRPLDKRYRSIQKTISLENKQRLNLSETFDPILTRLILDSDPSGASVILDGEELSDTTPIVIIDIIIGKHKVILKAAPHGFVPMERSIDLEAKPENDIVLKFSQKGLLKVTSNPSGADVYVDESHKGLTPITIRNLSQGNYNIKITKLKMIEHVETVRVNDGQVTNVHAPLKKVDIKVMQESDPFVVMATGFVMTSGDRKLNMKLYDTSKGEKEEISTLKISDADMGDYLGGGYLDIALSRNALRLLLLAPNIANLDSASNRNKVHLGFVIGGSWFQNKIQDGSARIFQGGFYLGYTHRWGRLAECLDLMVLWTDYYLDMENKQGEKIKYKTKTLVMDFIPRNRLIYYLMKDPYAASGAFLTFDLMANLSNIPALGGGMSLGYQW